MHTRTYFVLPASVAVTVLGLVTWVAARPTFLSHRPAKPDTSESVAVAADRVNSLLQTKWTDQSIEPAATADDFQVYRRLAIALVGTPPSL